MGQRISVKIRSLSFGGELETEAEGYSALKCIEKVF